MEQKKWFIQNLETKPVNQFWPQRRKIRSQIGAKILGQNWYRWNNQEVSRFDYMVKTILTKNQTLLLEQISKDNRFLKHFYLTGGTALSEFYLHHRLSEDLDFFSEQEIEKSWLTTLVTNLTHKLPIKTVDRREIFNRNLIFLNFTTGLVKTLCPTFHWLVFASYN